jgi:hypothetical protein
MALLLTKPGVEFTVIAPAGFQILWALQEIARDGNQDLTITSACDGLHSGVDDPHHRGEAYDLRCHDFPDPALLLQDVQHVLGTGTFFSFIEDEGTPEEHIHIQLRKGMSYP